MNRFIDNENGTITDTKKWLMWEKEGSKRFMTFKEIADWKQQMSHGICLYQDWRLPTVQELISIEKLFDNKTYWANDKFSVDMLNNCDIASKKVRDKAFVRCVRTITESEKALIIKLLEIDSMEMSKETARNIFVKMEKAKRDTDKSELVFPGKK